LLNFGALSPNLFLDFFPAREVPEIICNESSRNTENSIFEGGLGKKPQGILRNQSISGFFGIEFSFQKCLWNLFITSGLSQIC
jgi:hypothetical protein